jgi:hypothetical protein
MNGNTTVLQRAIIGGKGPIAIKQENEMLCLRKRVRELDADNAALQSQIFALQNRLAEFSVRPPLRVASIIKVVCRYFEISDLEIRGDGRRLAVVRPRHIAMYLSRRLTFCSYPTIGLMFGDRDHTTVMYAHDKIAELRKIDEQLNKQITAIESQFLLPNDALDHPGRASSEPAPTSPDTLGAGLLT